MAEALISVIAPHKCLVCRASGSLLCEPCRLTVLSSPPSRCYSCHAVSAQSRVCLKCRQRTALRHVWVASDYQDVAKELMRRFKFERSSAASYPVAAAIEAVLPDLPSQTIVLHIPTANSRARVRGYDQAELIARKVASSRSWRHMTLLMRRGSSRQVGSGRTERFKQLEAALVAIRLNQIKGARILLIDDVTTTGATLEAAAKVLKACGAKNIDAAVFAQPLN